jgi:hypothetical protein
VSSRRALVTEIVSVAWTPKGERLCLIFGMEQEGKDNENHNIFYLDFEVGPKNSAQSILPSIQKLWKITKTIEENRQT